MQAIVIDPRREAVQVVEIEPDPGGSILASLYRIIGTDGIDVLKLGEDPATGQDWTLYIDDEGLYRPNQRYFALADYPQPIAGVGVIVNTDAQGDSADATLSVADLWGRLSWPKVRFVGTRQVERKTTLFGRPATEVVIEADFEPRKDEEKRGHDPNKKGK